MSFETEDVLLLHVGIDWKMNIATNLLLLLRSRRQLVFGAFFYWG